MTVKIFVMLQNISILNKCCSFELSINLWILKNKMYHSFYKNIKCFQKWIIIIIVSWAVNQHIIMISEDHVRLKTGAENTAAHHRNQLQFNTYSHKKQLLWISIIYQMLLYFGSNKCSLAEQKTTCWVYEHGHW